MDLSAGTEENGNLRRRHQRQAGLSQEAPPERAESTDLDQIGQDVLRDVIRNVVGDRHAEALAWNVHAIIGGASGSTVQLITGRAGTRSGEVPCSFVLKTFRMTDMSWQEAGPDPSSWNYWKREWLLYQAPWAKDLRGIRAPRCFGAGEIDASTCWVALEDLRPYDRRPWSDPDFIACARHLGEFNGAFLSDGGPPADPWLAQDWLRGWFGRSAPLFEHLEAIAADPELVDVFPPDRLRLISRIWEHREDLFAPLPSFRQTIVHNDVFVRNAFVDHDQDRTIAIDWAFCGIAPLGVEIVPLLVASLAFFEINVRQADRLEPLCLDAYRTGLGRAGVDVTADELSTAYLITFGLRQMIGTSGIVLALTADKSLRGFLEAAMGHSTQELLANWAAIIGFGEPRMTALLSEFGYS